jgi:dynamin family protein
MPEVRWNGRLRNLARLADEAGARAIAADAEAWAERLRAGRFYVACVGQFKRGKSALVNALIDAPVLPTGVIPITAAVTVVRYGERPAVRVRFGGRDWEECEPPALATYVSEEHNPDNENGVTGVEVFVSSDLLESGLCLVDTPGLGSVSDANAAATREFTPHIDAAIAVLGTDPPISGEEVALVQGLARQINDLVFVLNKADRQSDEERREAIGFTERVLADRLRRSPGPMPQVSALERIARTGPPRDWDRLVHTLRSLATVSGAGLVRSAEQRGVTMLVERLQRDLDEQRAALIRPIEESQARVEALRLAVTEAERALVDLGALLTAEQERLGRPFTEERDRFFRAALPSARRELAGMIRAESHVTALRERAIDLTIETADRWLDRWRREQEPKVQAFYREAMTRFVEVVNGFRARLAAAPGLEGLSPAGVDVGLRTASRLHYTRMLRVAPWSARRSLLDRLRSRRRRLRAIQRAAGGYLERLLDVNSMRVKNEFLERVSESRRLLETELRDRLRELASSAEQALERARQTRSAGAAAVDARLISIAALRSRVEQVLRPDRA